MADPKHLELARQGKDAWNQWRKENPDEPADFSSADFTVLENEGISFAGFEFGNNARFQGATFGNYAHFEGTTFGDHANFESATFGKWAIFQGATFSKVVNFYGATFGKWAIFESATFGKWAIFQGATFSNDANFKRATFSDWANFYGATFKSAADFTRARFDQPPGFSGAKGLEHLNLVGTQFRFGKGFLRWTSNPKTVADLRHLRGIAKDIHATDAERDLFILERMAERGVLWKNWWDGGWTSRLFGWWQPASATVLMFFYWILSNCGRSVALPILWFIAANAGAYYVYSRLADTPVDEGLWNLTLANMLPFGTLAKPLSEHAAAELFYGGVLPPAVGLAAIGQGVVNALLIFLLALALRNHFKVK